MLNGVPQFLLTYTVVIMYKNMTHSFHHLPGYLRVAVSELLGKLVCSLANNLNKLYITIKLDGICLDYIKSVIPSPFEKHIACIEDMLKASRIISWLSHK